MTGSTRHHPAPSSPAISAARPAALLILSLLYKAILDTLYVVLISPAWSYDGLSTSVDTYKTGESYLILAALALVLSLLQERPSRYLLLFSFYTGLVPLLSIYGLQDRPSEFVYAAVASFLLSVAAASIPRIAISTTGIGAPVFTGVNVSVVLLVMMWVVARGGLSFLNFDITAVYDYRREVDTITYIGAFAYLINWTSNVFLVALLVQGMHQHRLSLIIFAVFGEVFLFSTLANKILSLRYLLSSAPTGSRGNGTRVYVLLSYSSRSRRLVSLSWPPLAHLTGPGS